jgi:hypothetical protein
MPHPPMETPFPASWGGLASPSVPDVFPLRLEGGRFCPRPPRSSVAVAACYDLRSVATCFSDSAESLDALCIDVPVEVDRIEANFTPYANGGKFTALPETAYVPGSVVQVVRSAVEVKEPSDILGRWHWACGHCIPPSLDRPETAALCGIDPRTLSRPPWRHHRPPVPESE